MNNIEFLTCLAKGFNPFTGEKCQNNEVLRDPDIVAGIYDIILELKENGRKVSVKNFKYDPNLGPMISIIEPHTTIQFFAKEIEKVVSLGFTHIQKRIQEYLIENGLLEIKPDVYENNALRKFATTAGESHGIRNEVNTSNNGRTYHKVIYTPQAQKYIIELLDRILVFENK